MVGEFLARLTARELSEYVAWYQLEAEQEAEAHRRAEQQQKRGR